MIMNKTRSTVIAALAIASALTFSACSSDAGPGTGAQPESPHEPVPTGPVGDAEGQPGYDGKIGETVHSGTFDFTVDRVERTDTIRGEFDETYTAQGEYVVLHLTVKNVGKRPAMFTDEDQVLVDANEAEYAPDIEALPLDDLGFDQNPGQAETGAIAFDVPKGTELSHVMLTESFDAEYAIVKLSE